MTLHYTVDMTCVTAGKYSIATELQEPVNLTTNQTMIVESVVHHTISNLKPGTTYHYCVLMSDDAGNFIEICGNDLPGGGVFTTDKPNPPTELNGAVLVSETSNVVVYRCPGNLERFNGESKTMVAGFDANMQTYALNGSCTRELYMQVS